MLAIVSIYIEFQVELNQSDCCCCCCSNINSQTRPPGYLNACVNYRLSRGTSCHECQQTARLNIVTLLVSAPSLGWLQQLSYLAQASLATHSVPPSPGFTYPCGDFVHSVAFLVLLRVRDSVKASELSSVPLRYHSDSDNIAKMKCQLASPYTFISWQLSSGQATRALPRAEVRCNYERQTFWKTYRPI